MAEKPILGPRMLECLLNTDIFPNYNDPNITLC